MRHCRILFWLMVLSAGIVCGGQAEESQSAVQTANPRIVGGDKVTSVNEYPWMVALGEYPGWSNQFSQSCGSTFIGDKWILTAAHCVTKEFSTTLESTDNMYVLFGTLDSRDTENGELVKVKRIQVHPDYEPFTTSSDIAILELENNVSGYEPLQLYRGSETLAGSPCTVIGWGDTVGYNYPAPVYDPEKLRHVSISVISNEQCQQAYDTKGVNATIDTVMMCAGVADGGKDSCQGDSGGPLVIQEGGVWKQAGIVSWGLGECAEKGLYGVYTRVSEFVDFIDEYTASALYVSGTISFSLAGHENLPVMNADVAIEGTAYNTVTGENGEYLIRIPNGDISAGNYTLSVNAPGLMPFTQAITIQEPEGEIEVSQQLSSYIPGDFSGNKKLGLEDCIGILQTLSGAR